MMLSTVVALFFILIAFLITVFEPHLTARAAALMVPQPVLASPPPKRGRLMR